MLYFVAPDWWKPARREGTTALASTPDGTKIDAGDVIGGPLTSGRPNYPITEDSEPAVLGSSLGWLLQLDGDDHRNAFLNSAWVKAVLPIRPGKEKEAIEWLKRSHVEGADNFNAVEQKLNGLIAEINAKPGPANAAQNDDNAAPDNAAPDNAAPDNAAPDNAAPDNAAPDNAAVLGSEQEVYETGFSPLAGGFRVDEAALYSVMSDWWEVVPTDHTYAFEVDPAKPHATGSIRVKRPPRKP